MKISSFTCIINAMKANFYCVLLMFIISCKGPENDVKADTVLDEYPDWHVIKSPTDQTIFGVWGNYDKTILITTLLSIYRSSERGENWEQVHNQSLGMNGIAQFQDTLYTMNILANQTKKSDYQQVLVHADNYSVDDGKTWHRYVARNPILADLPEFDSPNKFLINPIIAPSKVSYQINRVYLDGPNATTGNFETPGVLKSTGEKIDLPQLHQIQSLSFDDQQRIYIAGSDAVCGSKESFKFCNSKGGRGVVYVSKDPQP
jgi:hypothetical protein